MAVPPPRTSWNVAVKALIAAPESRSLMMKPAVWLTAFVVIFRQPLLSGPPVVSTKALPYRLAPAGGPELKLAVKVPAEAVRMVVREMRRQRRKVFRMRACYRPRLVCQQA